MSRNPSAGNAVRKNTLWNVFGQGLPLGVAVFFIPRLIQDLGIERFGALTIIWTFLNYFGLFDLGIGRAMTQLLAGNARGNDREEATLIWTVSGLMVILGVIAGITLFFTASMFTTGLLRMHGLLESETTLALKELAIALPFLIHTIALKGVLDARRRFDISNMIRIPLGIFMYGAPLLIIPFTRNLGAIVAVLLVARAIAWAVNLVVVLRLLPHLRSQFLVAPKRIRELMRFGGWFTISNIVGPIIDNMDRFFINALLTISMVAYYTTPFEVVTKLLIIPASIAAALFPEFATRFGSDHAGARTLFLRGMKYLLMLLFPVALLLTAYAHEGLSLWLTPSFADHSAVVLRWLSLYILIASLTQVPFTFLLGVGRPRIPAVLHLIELVVYAALLYIFLKLDGLRGAAIAACLRMSFDFLGQFFFCGKLLHFKARTYAKVLGPMGVMLLVLLMFHIPLRPLPKAYLTAITLAVHAAVCWKWILEAPDKTAARRLLRRA